MFCLPFAGGGTTAYYRWRGRLPPELELRPVRLPGRESRMAEVPLDSVDAVVQELLPRLAAVIAGDAAPYVIFGYSMGATLGYELAAGLVDAGVTPPVLLAVGGCEAPQLPRRLPGLHRLADGPFIQALRALGGTPDELLEHPELMALLLPMIRTDFRLLETYECRRRPPVPCPVSTYTAPETLRLRRTA